MDNKIWIFIKLGLVLVFILFVTCTSKTKVNYNYHIAEIEKALATLDLSQKNNHDSSQTKLEVYDAFYCWIPKKDFYAHYYALKNSPLFNSMDSTTDFLDKALNYYALALKICFIRENQLVYESTMDQRLEILSEEQYKNIIVPKLKSYKYDTFNFNEIDNDSILHDSLSQQEVSTIIQRTFKEEILFRCRLCALWKEFINFYTKETADPIFKQLCEKNQCI